MIDPYQEHLDHVAGEATEHQNVYRQSMMNLPADDSEKIDALVAEGKHVVFQYHTAFCRHTDASLGQRKTYMKDFADRQEAEAYADDESRKMGDCDGESGVSILPYKPYHYPTSTDPEIGSLDGIPF